MQGAGSRCATATSPCPHAWHLASPMPLPGTVWHGTAPSAPNIDQLCSREAEGGSAGRWSQSKLSRVKIAGGQEWCQFINVLGMASRLLPAPRGINTHSWPCPVPLLLPVLLAGLCSWCWIWCGAVGTPGRQNLWYQGCATLLGGERGHHVPQLALPHQISLEARACATTRTQGCCTHTQAIRLEVVAVWGMRHALAPWEGKAFGNQAVTPCLEERRGCHVPPACSALRLEHKEVSVVPRVTAQDWGFWQCGAQDMH